MTQLALTMHVCGVDWCVALAVGANALCAVHTTRGQKYKPLAADAAEPDPADACEQCDGSGKCRTCDGDGTHRCSECHDDHDCGTCDASGKCDECGGSGLEPELVDIGDGRKKRVFRDVLDKKEQEYVQWALEGPLPTPVLYEQFWEATT